MKKKTIIISLILSMILSVLAPGFESKAATMDQSFWGQFSDQYFYNNMNMNQRALYDELDSICRDFLYNRQDAKPISAISKGYPESVYSLPKAAKYSGLSVDEAYNIYIIFSNANPQYYFLSAGAVSASSSSGQASIYGCVYNDYANASNRDYYNSLFETTLTGWISDVKSKPTLYEREKRIYELVIEKFQYAIGSWDEHQSSATAIFKNTTVCAGYSEVFAMLAKACNIPVVVVTSEEHEWVMVQMDDGKWYNVDATFDDNGSEPRWKYFNVPDQGFNADGKHSPEPIYSQLGRPVAVGNYNPNAQQNVNTNTQAPVVNDIPSSGIQTPYTGEKVDIYRLYNKNTGEHFYTPSAVERDALSASGWDYEGVAWKAPKSSTVPVYRLLNPNSGDHHYTTSAIERDALVVAGWKSESIGFYSDPNQGMPLYRLYNPNAKTGSHHYTNSAVERDNLIKAGWQNESVGFYATI